MRSRVSTPEVAEDLTQQALTKLFAAVAEGKNVKSLAAFLATTARNAVIDHYRTTRPFAGLPELPDDSHEVDEAGPIRRRIAGWMPATVEGLPEPYRSTLRMTEIEGLSYGTVSARLGVTISAVKSRVRRGREMIRRDLLNCCRFSYDAAGRVVDYEPVGRQSC